MSKPNIKVKYKISAKKLARKLAKKIAGAQGIQAKFASKVAYDTNNYVPMRSGTLASSVMRASDFAQGEIVYNTPYAKRQWRGVNFKFSRDKHPLATHHWFQVAKASLLDTWGQYAAKLLNGTWKRGS